MPDPDWKKERGEVLRIGVNFATAMDDGDSVDQLQDVQIVRETRGFWEDVSAEFGIGSPGGTLNGDVVEITLGAAAAGDQRTDAEYRIRAEVTTLNGETLIGTPSLLVRADGDVDAP